MLVNGKEHAKGEITYTVALSCRGGGVNIFRLNSAAVSIRGDGTLKSENAARTARGFVVI